MNAGSNHEAITPTFYIAHFYNQLVDVLSRMNFGVLLVFPKSRKVGIRPNYEAFFYVNNQSFNRLSFFFLMRCELYERFIKMTRFNGQLRSKPHSFGPTLLFEHRLLRTMSGRNIQNML